MRPPVGAPTLNRRTRSCPSPRASSCCYCGRVPPDQPLRRLAVVRRGRLPQRLHHDHLHAAPAVPARRGADRRAVALSLWIAYRFRPVFVRRLGTRRPIARYRTVIISRLPALRDRHPAARRPVRGFRGAGQLADRAAFRTPPPSASHGPAVRHRPVSFFAFELPFYRLVLGWLLAVTILASSARWSPTTCSAASG